MVVLKNEEMVFNEHAKKMRGRDNLLVSSNVLYHYLSGRSDEVIVLNEWNNIMDADQSIKQTADRRKKGWPNKKTRKPFKKNGVNIGQVDIQIWVIMN